MSRIEELIERLCPEGVEYRKLGDCIISLKTGLNPRKFFKLNESDSFYPYITGKDIFNNRINVTEKTDKISSDVIKLINKRAQLDDGNLLFASTGTGTVGRMAIIENYEDNWAISETLYSIKVDETYVNVKYLMYVLYTDIALSQYVPKISKGSVPHLKIKDLLNVSIPVPPLEVQQEIVRILDNFTNLSEKLNEELELRKKQYEYYREKLLSFEGEEVEWKKLSEVSTKISSGGTPSTKVMQYYEGDIPWLRTQEVDWKYVYDTEIKITQEAVNNSSAKLIPRDCLIIAMYGATAAKACINKIPLTTNQACCNIQIDSLQAINKYIFYWINKEYLTLKNMGEGSQSNLNAKKIKDFLVPIPPLSEQRRIVSILDAFDTLINDTKKGLPAEIAALNQQYEYYRDQLLTFKQK